MILELQIVIFFASMASIYFILDMVESMRLRRAYQVKTSKYVEQKQLQGFLGILKPYLSSLTSSLIKNDVFKSLYFNSKKKYFRLLQQAGNPGSLSPLEFNTFSFLLPAVVAFILIIFGIFEQHQHYPILIALFFISLILPGFWLKSAASARASIIQSKIPDAIDEISLIMKAGLGFEQSVDIYLDNQLNDPLKEEFYIMRSEMRLGKSISDALESMANRVSVDALTAFTVTVIQAESTGISIIESLSKQSEIIRERYFQKAEEQGSKAPLKILAPLMLLVLPTIFLIIFTPMIVSYLSK